MQYAAINRNKDILGRGAQLTDFRGNTGYTYQGTYHPRKVTVRTQDGAQREFYASVFDLGIFCPELNDYTFAPNWHESDKGNITC